jgi:hypothetical protein
MFELRYHHALPDKVKIVGLDIQSIAECEGGGYMIPLEQGRMIEAAPRMRDALKRMIDRFETFMKTGEAADAKESESIHMEMVDAVCSAEGCENPYRK